ncbi:hypothetical protein D9O50_06960 [Oxalobacteraceae bacterium CAVE-383]|nr:hypothetical protein D9O50_06960 [Oxalobacteraceae bacterium CAVE-383]
MQNNQLLSSTRILATIGQPRITPYRIYFRCKNDDETLGAYFWGQAIASAFQPCLGMYEVVLRNAIHRSASLFASQGQSESFTWYDSSEKWVLPMRGRTLEKVEELIHNRSGKPLLRYASQASPDAVVAALSFGFWPGFLQGLSQRERPRIFTDTFTYHPKSKPRHWSDTAHITALVAQLKAIQSMRNAVAHLEPIWKPHRLNGTEKHWSQSVASLRGSMDTISTIMEWCCPASAEATKQSCSGRIFRSICSTDAVQAFMDNPFNAGKMALFQPASRGQTFV